MAYPSPQTSASTASPSSSSPSSTPSPAASEFKETTAHILNIFHSLSALPDLCPSNPQVSHLFSDLVATCLRHLESTTAKLVLSDPRIEKITPELRRLCSEGESALEMYWAERILPALPLASDAEADDAAIHGMPTPSRHVLSPQKPRKPWNLDKEAAAWSLLRQFPYYANYTSITTRESLLIHRALPVSTPPTHILFIGSGPLPLTPWLLSSSHFPNAALTFLDHSLSALAVSKRLTTHLGLLAHGISFQHTSALTIPRRLLASASVTYLAALVGTSSAEKEGILRAVVSGMHKHAVLVVRSAWGLRGLLYPVLEVAGMDLGGLGLEFVEEWRDDEEGSEIVNSVVVFRVVR